MPAFVPYDIITLVPAADVATAGTMTFTYPTGNASRYAKSGEKLVVSGLQNSLAQAAGTFTLVYGASSVVVTYTAATTIPAGTSVSLQLPRTQKVGVQMLAFYMPLAEIAASGDLLTNYVPGYAFKILSVDARVLKPATTAAKLASLNLEIGTTDLTGGVVALTSANATPAGVAVAGTAITAGNVGTASDSFSIEASGVTAFVEGSIQLLVEIQNLDTLAEYNARSWS